MSITSKRKLKGEQMDNLSNTGVPSVRNAFRIIRHLNVAREGQGVNRIAAELDLNVSSCFRLLKTLATEGVLAFNPQTKTYRPAPGLVELARGVLGRTEVEKLRHIIEKISQQYDSTAMVMFPIEFDRAIITDVVERNSPMRLKIDVGEDFQYFAGAYGRCFAAALNLSKSELKKHFANTQWDKRPTFEKYCSEVRQAQKDGYAFDIGNHLDGVAKISACAVGINGHPKFALSVLAFSSQFSKAEYRQIGLDLRAQVDALKDFEI